MNAMLLLTTTNTKLRKPNQNICPPSLLDGFSAEKEAERAKTTKEHISYLTLDVVAP
jgi:hypothetical protein